MFQCDTKTARNAAFEALERQDADLLAQAASRLPAGPDELLRQTGLSLLCMAISKNWREGAACLLDAGADPLAFDARDMNAFCQAALCPETDILAELLLRRPEGRFLASPASGETPLHYACAFRREKAALALWLPGLESIQDKARVPAYELALASGMGAFAQNCTGQNPELIAMPCQSPALSFLLTTARLQGRPRILIPEAFGHAELARLLAPWLGCAEKRSLLGATLLPAGAEGSKSL